jgi:thiopurine S-methyltransferase
VKTEYWQERWTTSQIGFHEGAPNALLMQHIDRLHVPPRTAVYVPLCGMAQDMVLLHERLRRRVVGSELAPEALAQFFGSLGERPRVSAGAEHVVWQDDACAYSLFEGDAFALTTDIIRDACKMPVGAVYDRAALVAVDPAMRTAYVEHCTRLLPTGGTIFLITFDYAQELAPGPPWSVDGGVVRALYGDAFAIEALSSTQRPANARFAAAGIASIGESAWLLTKRG